MAAPLLRIRASDGRRPIVFDWGVSSYFGRGLHGLNFALALSGHPSFYPLVAQPFSRDDCAVDPLRLAQLDAFADRSAFLWDGLRDAPDDTAEIDAPVLIGLGANLIGISPAGGKRLIGRPSVGVVVLEHSKIDTDGRARAEQLSLIIAGSRWNEHVLRANGIVATTTVWQGVDTALFHPAPRTGRFRDRFVIFSGGKLAFRKGQDLVLKAFKVFHQRHPEALLLAAWGHGRQGHDAFPAELTDTISAQPAPDGRVDSARWALDNGIPPDALIALGRIPNIAMPHVLREADVGLFPNRCESGTNPVAMECMACGVPLILSANTGHLDLLESGDVALPLTRQTPVAWKDTDVVDWGESDIDEILERLEQVWLDREAARSLGQRAGAFMGTMTWARQTEHLIRALRPLLP